MADKDRKVALLPFEKARTVKVILILDDPQCMDSYTFLCSEAEKHGIELKFLLINPHKSPVPQWLVKDNITVLNYKKDFTKSKLLNSTADKFCDGNCDICMTLSTKPAYIVNELSFRTESTLRLGPDFGESHPFDIAFKYKKGSPSTSMVTDMIQHLRNIARINISETSF